MADALREAGRQVDEFPRAEGRACLPSSLARRARRVVGQPRWSGTAWAGVRLERFDEHARLGWAAAIAITAGDAGDAEVILRWRPTVITAASSCAPSTRSAPTRWTADTTLDALPATPPR